MAKKKREHKLWNEFKAFISRGNAFDMAVGVVIGGAFSAIVTALVGILMSLATWGVPGGLAGLITVLPALPGSNQAGIAGIGQVFNSSELTQMTITYAKSTADVEITAADATFVQWQQQLTSKYTLHGGQYVWNSAAFLDWGALINAVISFLIIAITLFIVVKVVNSLRAARLAAEEKAKAQLEGEKTEEEKPAEETAE